LRRNKKEVQPKMTAVEFLMTSSDFLTIRTIVEISFAEIKRKAEVLIGERNMKYEETWLGIGIKSGGQLLFGGVESISGQFFNLGIASLTPRFTMTSSRWGLGLGGGIQLSCICVFKLKGIYWLDGREFEDWGVNIDLGGKWKHAAKILEGKKFFTQIKIASAVGHIITNLDEIRDGMHYLYNLYDFDHNGDHPTLSFDVPLAGLGLELSAFKTSGTMWID
jgi:hypothetical protein